MEEDHMLGAQEARHAEEPKLRKRRRSPVEVVDLSEAPTQHPSLRHLPRLRVSPPKQNQPEPNFKLVSPAQESPIYLDAEPSPIKEPARQSRHRRTTATANAEPVISPRRTSLRTSVPSARRSQWGEFEDAHRAAQANMNNKTNNNDHGGGDDDGFLARRLQAEEELRVARQRRALEYRMQELERAEAAALAAVAAGERGEQEEMQQYQYQRGQRHYPRQPFPAADERPSSRGRAYNNSRRLFSNSSGRYGRDNTASNANNNNGNSGRYEAPTSGRTKRGGAGGTGGDPLMYGAEHYAESAAMAGAEARARASSLLDRGPPPPQRHRGWPRHGSSSPMGFSEAMSEYFFREAAAEMAAEAAAEAAARHLDEEVPNQAEQDADDEAMREFEMWQGRSRMGPALARRRGPGRPREGHPFSSFIGELAALHQAVLGARSSALPSELLFSDRDFTEADYEALLALDEGVENRKGAKQDVINQLPSERVPRGGAGHAVAAAYGDCCICLDRIGAGQVVRKLECSHHFHKGCVDKWLKQKASCPICQRKILEGGVL